MTLLYKYQRVVYYWLVFMLILLCTGLAGCKSAPPAAADSKGHIKLWTVGGCGGNARESAAARYAVGKYGRGHFGHADDGTIGSNQFAATSVMLLN